MRIGFFVWEYPPRLVGGLGTYAQNVAPLLVELGNDVSLFTINPGNLPTREIMRGVEVHRPLLIAAEDVFPIFVTEDLRKWGTHLKFFSDVFIYNIISASKFVGELVKKEGYDFDLVCVHDWLSSIAGISIKKELGIPVVFHVHSTEWGRTMGAGSVVVSHLEDTCARLSNKIITVSYPMQDDLIKHGWDANKIRVVWNGVDPEVYDPGRCKKEDVEALRNRYGVNDNEFMILFVGRLTGVKGVVNLVQAMPLVLHKHPNVKLVILGSGELERTIVNLTRTLKIEDNVKFNFQFVSEEERILHYAACDLAVFPSTYEPFGIVALEAMAMEKPVVVGASGVSGFRDQVIISGPDRTGVHVDGNNPGDIAWGINSVLDDPDEAVKMGKRGRERVCKYFTWRSCAESTIRIYEETLQNAGGEKALLSG